MLLRHHCLIIHPFLKAKEKPIKRKRAQCQTWTQQLIWSNTKLEAQGTELRLPFRGALSSQVDPMSRGNHGRFSCVRLRRGERERERERGYGVSLWTLPELQITFPVVTRTLSGCDDACGGGVVAEICIILTNARREKDEDGRQKGGASTHSFNNSEFCVSSIPHM